MNPLKFYGSKVDKYPQEFIEGIKKITNIMGVTLVKSAELAVHLKVVAYIWYKEWKKDRVVNKAPVDWKILRLLFWTCSSHSS